MSFLTLISGFFLSVSSYLVLGLIAKNATFQMSFLTILAAFIIGLTGCRLVMILQVNTNTNVKMTKTKIGLTVLSLTSFNFLNDETNDDFTPANAQLKADSQINLTKVKN